MTLLDRYLFKTVLVNALLALLALLAIETVFTLISELERLGESGYGLIQVARYVLLSLPGLAYQTLPLALLVGGLLGVGALAAGNELLVIRASGWSPLRLGRGALAAALLLGCGALALGEFVVPAAERLAGQLRAGSRLDGAVASAAGGFWARDDRQVVRVGAILPDHSLAELSIYEIGEQGRLRLALSAERAVFEGNIWRLEQVRFSRFQDPDADAGARRQLLWQTDLRPDTLQLLNVDPEHLALGELGDYIDYLAANALDPRPYQLALWLKLVTPLTCVAMLLAGLPFTLAHGRIAGAGQRLLLGVLLGLGFYLFNRMLGSWVLLSGMPPWLGALTPTLALLGAGLLALRR